MLSIEAVVITGIKWLVQIAAACALFSMLIAVADVIGSKFFNWAVPNSGGIIEELMVFMVFLSIAHVEKNRGHIRIVLLEKYLSPSLNNSLRLFGDAVSILLLGFLAWRALINLEYVITVGMMKQGTIQFPLWPSSLAIFLGWTCLIVVYILRLYRTTLVRPKQ